MFKKFRIKVVAIIMSVLSIVLVGILIAIYVASYQKSITHTNFMLKNLCIYNGFEKLEKPKKSNDYDSNKYYLVLLGNDQTILKISNDSNSGYSDEELGKLAITLSQKVTRHGIASNLSYVVSERKKGTYVAFFNNSYQTSYFNTLFYNILIFGCIGLILLLFISMWLSGWIIAPVENAFQKQKQFISDASHELKTPITIISANADALQREIGESKWLEYIRNETIRMNSLVNDLLQLAAIDACEDRSMYTKLNFSETVMSIVLPFECIAFEKQINLNEQIKDNIFIMGDSSKLGQLISILIDNALNHTDKGGSITIKLVHKRDNAILTVSNIGKEIPLSEQELIFERFYRADKARTRENGRYGLGLAIAKSITNSHGGKISVSCKNNWTTFKVVI